MTTTESLELCAFTLEHCLGSRNEIYQKLLKGSLKKLQWYSHQYHGATVAATRARRAAAAAVARTAVPGPARGTRSLADRQTLGEYAHVTCCTMFI